MSKMKQGQGGARPRFEGTTAGGAIVRSFGDGFDAPSQTRKKVEIAPPTRPTPAPRRGRLLDPRLIPVVPAHVTSDAGRQIHALLGLPSKSRKPSRPLQGPVDLDALLESLQPARAQQLKRVLLGRPTELKRRLKAFIDDPKFAELDFESQRRALAAFELR